MNRSRHIPGFTIVELLIVMVVIAILATISVVAYNGITVRAENSKTVNAVSQTVRALKLIKSEEGSYPLIPLGGGGLFSYACVSDLNEQCGQVGGPNDGSCGGIGLANGYDLQGGTMFNTAIKAVTNTMPRVSSQNIDCQTKTVRGVLYLVLGGSDTSAYLVYFLKGNQVCTAISGTSIYEQEKYGSETVTRCTIQLPA